MAIPMVLLLATPIALVIFIWGAIIDRFRYDRESVYICAIPISMITFYVGCMLNVVTIPIILTVGPFLICFGLSKVLTDDYSNKNLARHRIDQRK